MQNVSISSSLWEDPGFVMVEAAFVNTCNLFRSCPSGPKEFIDNDKNGFIYKSNNDKSFEECLKNFLSISKINFHYNTDCLQKFCQNYLHLFIIKKIIIFIKLSYIKQFYKLLKID